MQEIVLKLWRNEAEKNWSLGINGLLYEAVTIEWVHEIVLHALLDAEELLYKNARKPAPLEGPLPFPPAEEG